MSVPIIEGIINYSKLRFHVSIHKIDGQQPKIMFYMMFMFDDVEFSWLSSLPEETSLWHISYSYIIYCFQQICTLDASD